MTTTRQAALDLGAAPRLRWTAGELRRLAPIAKQRGMQEVYQLIQAATQSRWLDDDTELPVSAQAADVLEALAR